MVSIFPGDNTAKVAGRDTSVGVTATQDNSVPAAEHLVAITKKLGSIHVNQHIAIISNSQLAPLGI